MTVVVVLVLGALLVAWTGPRLLERLLRRGVDAQVALVTWLALVSGVVISLAAAVIVMLLPGHGPAHRVVTLVHHCWTALRTGSPPRLEAVVGLLGVLLVAVALVRGVIGVVRQYLRRRNLHQRHLDLLRVLADGGGGRYRTLWLDLAPPVAYSLAGRPHLVVASDGLRQTLPAESVAAVLAHERAHRRGRHHLLVGLATGLAQAFPWLPLMRCSPDFVRTAVELSADSVAARMHGCDAVRTALLGLSAQGTPGPALGMARDAIELRLAMLSASRGARAPVSRAVRSGFSGAAALTLPLVASAAILAVATVTSCPVLD